MSKKSIPSTVQRRLFSDSGGYCQNPNCNKYIFDSDEVTLSDMAHIVSQATSGPRAKKKLSAEYIKQNGYDNILILCLNCHRKIDHLEEKFKVEELLDWKKNHKDKIESLFLIPKFENETELLQSINDKLDENRQLFEDYGPFSKIAQTGSPDAKKNWEKVCRKKILPNNKYIVQVIEKNKRIREYPWDVYRKMLGYKTHVDSFEENCLSTDKLDKYKTFPPEFSHFIKTKLDIPVEPLEQKIDKQSVEYRTKSMEHLFNEVLGNHTVIKDKEGRDLYICHLTYENGKEFRVFVTNTYFFTEYTLNQILNVDPGIDIILCSNPYSRYSEDVKKISLEKNIGLFTFSEFKNINYDKDHFFNNTLPEQNKNDRINSIMDCLKECGVEVMVDIYLYGSYLRHITYKDIDILIVHENELDPESIQDLIYEVKKSFPEKIRYKIDIETTDKKNAREIPMSYDNRTKVWSNV